MFELSVYYNDVLRYTIIANLDKVQELRNEGYYVQVKAIPSQDHDWAGGGHPDRHLSIEENDVYHLTRL